MPVQVEEVKKETPGPQPRTSLRKSTIDIMSDSSSSEESKEEEQACEVLFGEKGTREAEREAI